MHRALATIALGAIALGAIASCERGPAGPRTISEWGLFRPGTHEPMPDLVPYEIVAPLFSDHAYKERFIRLPEGGAIRVEGGRWIFPVGTVLVKSFGFQADLRDPSSARDLVETRLLVLEGEGEGEWRPYVYIWNEAETDAELVPAGRLVPTSFVGSDGATLEFDYRVPSHTQCRNCHGGRDTSAPLGPRTAQMDVPGQLERLAARAMFAGGRPPPESVAIVDYREVLDRLETATDEEIDTAARSYLHANCAHCHRDGGGAQQSALWLRVDDEPLHASDPSRLGLCRLPIAGGCEYGSVTIRPGDPDDSILMCRIESTRAGDRMPELPAVLVYHEANELIREWIRRMPATLCD